MTGVSERTAVGLAAAALAITMGVPSAALVTAQSPAAIAGRLTGRWKLNVELTPASAKPARGRGQASFAVTGMAVQRGGRGGGRGGAGESGSGEASAPLTAEEVAAQAALSVLHQVPMELTIEATAETVVFREPRGEWRFTIDGRNAAMEIPGGTLHSKSRWDRGALRQEFSSGQRKLVKSWIVDANDRLVLTERIESITMNSESKAVFDRN
jgi:hypothetical protein